MKVRFLDSADEIREKWQEVSSLLARVITKACHGEFELDDIYRSALKGRARIGTFSDGNKMILAFVFEFRYYPKTLSINILALGGSHMKEVFGEFLEQFKAWATTAGADFLEASCSPAMSRMLAKYGYVNLYQQLRLDLKKEGVKS